MFAHEVPHVAGALKSVSQPSSAPVPSSALQSPKPRLHVGSQTPPSQAVAKVFALLQARPQALQCASLVASAVSQPSSGPEPSLSGTQSSKPALQVGSQRPSKHAVSEAPASLQARPHALQFAASPARSVSQPSSSPEPSSTSQSA